MGHFVLSQREREKRDRRDSRGIESKEERGTGMKVQKQKKQANSMGNLCPPPNFYLRC